MTTLVLFPDVEAWAVGYLKVAIAARAEAYCSGVTVSNDRKGDTGRVVTVRNDGGPQLDPIRSVARLGVNVWAATNEDATDLANMVRALLLASPNGNPVVRARGQSGPIAIPDDVGPHRYLTVELTVRGTAA